LRAFLFERASLRPSAPARPTPKATPPLQDKPQTPEVGLDLPEFENGRPGSPESKGERKTTRKAPAQDEKSPVEHGCPDLEMPGMMAIPWAIPMTKASIHLIPSRDLPSPFL